MRQRHLAPGLSGFFPDLVPVNTRLVPTLDGKNLLVQFFLQVIRRNPQCCAAFPNE
jgi:hypothetical protein